MDNSLLLEIKDLREQLADDRFLSKFKEYVDENKLLVMTDEGAYLKFLEGATQKIAREMKRRATA